MKNRIVSSILTLLLLVGLIPTVNAANAIELNKVTTGDSVSIDKDESIFEDKVDSTTDSQVTIEEDYDIDLYSGHNIDEGTYTLDYSLFKENTEEYSKINDYIEKSTLEVGLDGSLKLVLTLNNSSKISSIGVKVNNSSTEVTRNEINNNKFTIEFPIKGLTDSINIKAYVKSTWFNNTYSSDFIINRIMDDGTYLLDVDVYKQGEKEDSKAKSFIEKSVLEVNDGEMKAVLTFTGASMIPETTAKVNGNEVEVTRTEIGNSKFKMEFKIGSISDTINIGVAVKAGSYSSAHSVDFIINNIIKDGTYVLDDFISNGTRYINESTLEVKDQEMSLAIKFNMGNLITFNSLSINGTNSKYEVTEDSAAKTKTIKFNIDSLYDDIVISMTVAIPIQGQDPHVYDISFKILEKEEIEDGETDSGSDEEDGNDSNIEILKDGNYTVESKILKTGTSETSYASQYIESQSNLKVENGKYNLTLKVKDISIFTNVSATVDGNKVEAKTTKNNDGSGTISFNINLLRSKILIASRIIVPALNYDSNIDFNVSLNTSNLKDEQGNIVTPPNEGTDDSENNNGSNSGNDSEEEEDDDDDDDDLEDGTYTIKNKALKENSNATSDARGYLDDESIITVKNGKIYLTLKFTHGKMMSDTSIKVEGKKTSYTTVKKSGNKFYIKFKIGSLSDEVLVTSTIDTGIPSIGVLKGTKFRVLLRASTLEEDDDADDYDDDDDEDDEDTDEEDNNSNVDSSISDSSVNNVGTQGSTNGSLAQGSLGGNNGTQYKKATYKVNNEIVTDSSIGYQAARGAINKISYFEIENDTKNYITLGFNQTDIMDNIRLQINGNKVDYEIINQDKNNKTMEIRFPVPSISTEVTVTTTISAMGRDTTFGVKFLESTLELISVEESDSEITNNKVAGTLSSNGNAGSNIFGSTLEFTSDGGTASNADNNENIFIDNDIASEAKEYFKRYTINNEVLSDSVMGRKMARKYLNETSIIEEIDGKLYATVTFSSANSMGDFKIKVNGEDVQHSVVLKDEASELISLRFPMSSINDDIRIYMYVKPMKMNINFGIKFLENTLILIEEGTIGGEEEKETTSLAENLATINNGTQKSEVSVWKIAILTSVLSTILNFSVGGLIYLIVKRRKKKVVNE